MKVIKFFARSLSLKIILLKLPKSDFGDRIFCFFMFIYAHRRVPKRNSGLVNDYFYFLKTSNEALNVARQFTSDKKLVKSYISSVLGENYVVPTKKVFNSLDEIGNLEEFSPCVLKPAHSSGAVVFIQTDRSKLTSRERDLLQGSLDSSPYITAREKNYKYLKPSIICEEMLPDGADIKDYKFFCYKGRVRAIQVDSERQSSHKRNMYDRNWNPFYFSYNFPIGDWEETPSKFREMKALAESISFDFESVRVDFFISGDNLYIGELTHCPESAHGKFESLEAEKIFSQHYFLEISFD